MKHLFSSTPRIWLLLISGLVLHLTAHAQGMELFSITQSANKAANKATSLPPSVNVLDNSAQVETNYNLRLADTTAIKLSSDINRIDEHLRRARLEYDILVLQRDAARVARNSAERDSAQKKIRTLSATIKAQEDKRVSEGLAAKKVQDALQNRLTNIYEDQLTKLREESTRNYFVQQEALKSYDVQIKKLQQYQTTYWDSIPEPALETKEVRIADKAYREFDRKLRTIEQQASAAATAFSAFEQARKKLAAYKLSNNDTTSTGAKSANGLKEYNQVLASIQITTTELVTRVDTVRNSLTIYNQKVDKWNAAFKAQQAKKSTNDNNLTALPALTSIKGASLYIPAVSLIGSHRSGDDNSPSIYSIKLFTALGGPDNKNDVPSKRGTERLFIPDASTFGFSADAAFSFSHPARKSPMIGIVFGVAYLDKLMTPDSLTTFTTGTISVRANLEAYLIPDVLMVYGGFNSLSFLTERDRVTKHYTTTRPKDVYGFANAGVRAILKPGGDKSGVSFLFDLGFVLKGDNVKMFVPNDDFTITTIRATIAKNFALR